MGEMLRIDIFLAYNYRRLHANVGLVSVTAAGVSGPKMQYVVMRSGWGGRGG